MEDDTNTGGGTTDDTQDNTGDNTVDDTPKALEDMTKNELLTYAEDNNIDGVSSSMTKAEILAVIQAALENNDTP